MRSMLFKNSASDDTPLTQTSSSSEGCTFRPGLTPLEIAVSQWKNVWYTQFDWIDFDAQMGRVFCKVCRQKGGRSTFATVGSIKIRISAFQDDGKSAEHERLTWAMQKCERTMEKGIVEANRACDGAMHSLFQAAYYVGKEVIQFHRFPGLCALLVKVKANMMEKLYHDEKSCGEILFYISFVVQKKILDRVRDCRFFGIMIDESTDISVTTLLFLLFLLRTAFLFVYFLDYCILKKEKKCMYNI